MKNSANRSKRPLKVDNFESSAKASNRVIPIVLFGFVLLSFIGLLDSSYLSAKHFAGGPVECNFFSGCETVLNSKYSTIFGIPVALLGAAYYFTILFLSIYFLLEKKTEYIKFLAFFTIVGFFASMYFVILQLFILKAICEYCMLSATGSTLLFLLGLTLLRYEKSKKR